MMTIKRLRRYCYIFLLLSATSSFADIIPGVTNLNSKTDSQIRMEAIFAKAIKLNKPSICKEITWKVWMLDYGQTPEQSQDSCYLHFGIKTNNIEYCEQLSNTAKLSSDWSLRDKCIYGIAQKLKKPTLCKKLEIAKIKNEYNWLKICIDRATK